MSGPRWPVTEHVTAFHESRFPKQALGPNVTPLNRHREELLNLVRSRPGLTKKQAAEALDVAWNTIQHHASRLEKDGLISVLQGKWSHELYPSKTPRGLHQWVKAIHDTTMSRMMVAVAAEAKGLARLTQELAITKRVLRRRMSWLEQHRIVEKQGRRRPRYKLSPWPRSLPKLAETHNT